MKDPNNQIGRRIKAARMKKNWHIIFDTESDSIRKITRQLSQCTVKQLELINSIVESIIQIGLHE